jgi:cystine transport system permease protein
MFENSLNLILESLPFLAKGVVYTIELSVGGMFFGLLFGFLLALMRLSNRWYLSLLAKIYVSAFRGTPLLVQLFVIYYGLPQFGIRLDPIPCALIGFSLNSAAYISETIRASILSIHKNQWDTAKSLGMTHFQVMQSVIIPQAIRVALPSLGNSFIGLVKDTSLAATIQVPELFRQAQLISARTFEIFTMYICTSIIYWILSTILSIIQHKLEKHSSRYIKKIHN